MNFGAKWVNTSKTTRKHLFIPDCQIKPGDDLAFLSWVGKYAVDHKPDVIICGGDFADMQSLSSYDVGKKSFEGRKYIDDIDSAREAMDWLMIPIIKEQVRLQENKKKRWKPHMVFTLGNHENRINKAIETDRKLEGLISVDDLCYNEYWGVVPFLEPIVIDGVMYIHYLPSGVMDRPVTSARMLIAKGHMSCVVGHQQGRDVAYGKRADGKRITAIMSGSCYEHEEEYISKIGNKHWRGIVMLNEVCDGEFDEMFVSLDYLRRKYS